MPRQSYEPLNQHLFCTMIIFDIFVFVVAVVAAFSGWNRGFAVQAFGLCAIVIGLIAASRAGAQVGAALGVNEAYALPVGFIVMFIVVAGAVMLVGYFMRKVLKTIGLGSMDVVFGVLLALLNTALVLGVVCTVFDTFNNARHEPLIASQTLDKSLTYRPLCRLAETFGVLGREVGVDTGKITEEAMNNL